MNVLIAASIIVMLSCLFWRFILGIPLGVAYKCPECGRLLTKPFTYRVKQCPSCDIEIDWEKLINETDF